MSDKSAPPSFLTRRAQLKRANQLAATSTESPPATTAMPETAETDAEAAQAMPVETAPSTRVVDLPPPEELDERADFSGYLVEGVSEDLRRRALSRLFRLPQFGINDGLNDYDDDYTQLASLGEVSTYRRRRFEEPPVDENAAGSPQVAEVVEPSESLPGSDPEVAADETGGQGEAESADEETEPDGDSEVV